MSHLSDDVVKSMTNRIHCRKLQRVSVLIVFSMTSVFYIILIMKGRRSRCLLRHVREKEQQLMEADRASSEWLAERRRKELKMKLVSYLLYHCTTV